MNPPSKDIGTFLERASLGVHGANHGWSIQIAVGQPKPDTIIVLTDYEGEAPDTDELDLYRHRVQVAVRCRSYELAYQKQVAIRSALNAISSETIDGKTYLSITPISDIISTGQDDNGRFILTSNFQALAT